ncbi:unnamed protein product [Paramecium octaurelia]|uniref:Uncharacterized protein n=1 Tax=Paramecium octaurelia TaxID=43137 RepID=A0A8S1Y9N3_PAROT|nr:unnamed protein product [Paramecium octaurelia]
MKLVLNRENLQNNRHTTKLKFNRNLTNTPLFCFLQLEAIMIFKIQKKTQITATTLRMESGQSFGKKKLREILKPIQEKHIKGEDR